jgi:hypothetical protein
MALGKQNIGPSWEVAGMSRVWDFLRRHRQSHGNRGGEVNAILATAFNRRWNYRYIYWHQNLSSAESQQVLFAMDLSARYIK